MPSSTRTALLLLFLGAGAACGEDDENPPSIRAKPGPDPNGAEDGAGQGTTPLRRLTKTEYVNTVRDLLGETFGIAETVADDAASNGFDNGSQTFSISTPLVQQYISIAERLSAKVDPLKLGACDSTADEATCARSLATKIGPRAYRRPLPPAEVDDLVSLYTTTRKANDQLTSLRALLTRILVSPDFLYHVEIGEAPGADGSSPNVTPHELASRLSFFLWESMPDDALLAAAASAALRDRAQVSSQIDRMFADPRAKATVWHMHRQWLELDRLDALVKDAKVYPGFDPAKVDVLEGTHRFLDEVVWNGAGNLDALFTAPFTFANASVAGLYGLSASGSGFVRVDTDPSQRAGILGQPALLAAFGKADKSSPILRGVFVRDRLLCDPLPPPPPGVANVPLDAPAAKTTREFFANITSPEACQTCHKQIDPIGVGLENFDGIGRYRTTENSLPVDASGALTSGNTAGPFNGSIELSKKLAQSQAVQTCIVRQWFRFAYGRTDIAGDVAVVNAVAGQFRDGGSVIRSLPVALAKAEPFYRLHYSLKPSAP